MENTKIKEIFQLRNSNERFFMLKEVCDMLIAKGINPKNLFRSLLKAYSCELWFEFGNVSILLERGETEHSISQEIIEEDACGNIVEMSVVLENNLTSKAVTYKYRPNELCNIDFASDPISSSSQLEIAQRKKRKTVEANSSRSQKARIRTSKRITSYLRKTSRFVSVSEVSKELGISYQNTTQTLVWLEALALVERTIQGHGKKEYHFVKLTSRGKRLCNTSMKRKLKQTRSTKQRHSDSRN